jgi:signal transduction histidine kinase
MSFLILPRGPIEPLYGLIWLRGPLLAASGIALLWLCTLRLSRRVDVVVHALVSLPPLAVSAWYLYLGSYGPAITLCLLGLAIAFSPAAPRRIRTTPWTPDALGLVLGLALAAQGAELLLWQGPPVVPFGMQSGLAVAFVITGCAVAVAHLTVRTPLPAAWAAHVAAGAALFVLYVVLALGVASVLWVLNASALLMAAAVTALPWLSVRLVTRGTPAVRPRLAIALFSASLMTVLIAVPIVLALSEPAEGGAVAVRQAAFAATLALSLCAAVGGWLLARQLVGSLSRLVAAVERIAGGGERGIELGSGAPREIQEVAAAVETMANRLDEHAAQEERNRLARDLHDSITQALFAAALKAEVLADDVALPRDVTTNAEEVRRLTRGALAQMRTLLLELRGEGYRQIPIDHLLRNAVEAMESRTSVVAELRVRGDGVPAGELHSAVYRVTQEALNNVARHAKARHVVVELECGAGNVRLTVHDDGCGFDAEAEAPAGHLGLRSMRERAKEAGADLRVLSAPGEGTLVILDWRAQEPAEALPSLV